ncbi:HAD superfamily hydrolase [Niveomyces insectorum RCEF 264]|uniref:HAD superfamily hydrolase n=1 Tax=Niveomyces insectorum RCEF 264 TaxID=1081102 RepID=A0A167URT9_9HYPO|nr:HAD superfamily hydrolase [Niveomyces insectorum RCEF 264]
MHTGTFVFAIGPRLLSVAAHHAPSVRLRLVRPFAAPGRRCARPTVPVYAATTPPLTTRSFSDFTTPAAMATATPPDTTIASLAVPLRKRFLPLKGRTAAKSSMPSPGAPSTFPVAGHHHHHPKVLRGVVFDVDGTMCLPQTYMFGEMRAALGITKSVDILDHIYALPTAEQREDAMERIRAIERRAMASQEAQPGLAPLMAYLDRRGVPKAICTRNFAQPVQHLLDTFLAGHVFAPIVTRDFRPPKPDPAGILHIARSWGLTRPPAEPDAGGQAHGQRIPAGARPRSTTIGSVSSDEDTADRSVVLAEQEEEEAAERTAAAIAASGTAPGGATGAATVAATAAADAASPPVPVPEADASGLIMVGDSVDDMAAGRRAGAATVLLVNDVNRHLAEHADTDLVITRLDELIDVLENGFVGREIPHHAPT